jgi:hypothetical protein
MFDKGQRYSLNPSFSIRFFYLKYNVWVLLQFVSHMSLLQYLYPAFLALISPDGRQVVYTLSPFLKKDANPISTLWIADIDKPDSARPLTSGLVKDEQPRWSPDGRYLAFVSDRHMAELHRPYT